MSTMRFNFRPLPIWLGPETERRRSRNTFSAPWSDTLSMLERELKYLGAQAGVIEADFQESDIRLDGLPRSNAKAPLHPGVRIFFESKHGPLVYQTDSCLFWQHNVRSIALGLESLRAVDRYGITYKSEQYVGWRAIESSASVLNEEAAREIILAKSGADRWPLDVDQQRRLVRIARRHTHPDHGHETTDFLLVQDAAKKLGLS